MGRHGRPVDERVGVDTTFMYRDHSVSTGTGLIRWTRIGLNTIVDGDSACAALTWDETTRPSRL